MNLSELITAHKADRSYADLERACGGNPKAARWQQLATKPIKTFPEPETIEAIARGLRVTEVAVLIAAAESLGLDVRRTTPALFDRLPAGVENLSEEQLRPIVDIARAFVEANQVATVLEIEKVASIREWEKKHPVREVERPDSSEADGTLADAALKPEPGLDQPAGGSDDGA